MSTVVYVPRSLGGTLILTIGPVPVPTVTPAGTLALGTMPVGAIVEGREPAGILALGTMPLGAVAQGREPTGTISLGIIPSGTIKAG